MSSPADLVTVYRSMDANAKEDCERLVEILQAREIPAVILDDDAPGVVEGTFEVRVPAAQAARAEKLIADNPLPDEVEEVDNSSELDLETVFEAEGSIAEIQALGIKSLLESNGIAPVLMGDSVLPNFPFAVKVAHEQAERARELIAEAENSAPDSDETE